MTTPHSVFEVSWEVCNKVTGIHTALAHRARISTERLGNAYVTVGPWLLSGGARRAFDEDDCMSDFCEACREAGTPVRIGRWRIPGNPRAILVEFSGLYDRKDDILAELWEHHGVDSIAGNWDYVEPVLFGYAAGCVVEKWWEEYLAPQRRRTVVHCHDWRTASTLLHLHRQVPSIGTVFSAHGTSVGRALATVGQSPSEGLGDETPAAVASSHGIAAQHSLEGTTARAADVLATVSDGTGREIEMLHARAPDLVLQGGIDQHVVDELRSGVSRDEIRSDLQQLARRFLGHDIGDAVLLATAGRYEYRVKGIDLLLDAAAEVKSREGRGVVLFLLVPAGNSGLRSELRERLAQPADAAVGPLGLSTHNLFDEESDPIHEQCARLGLDNAVGDRVHIVHVPIYLQRGDDFLGHNYEAVVQAFDGTCFPSFYEPWGFTPLESMALGVPTVTSDYAGIGNWAQEQELTKADGVRVQKRARVPYDDAKQALADILEELIADAGHDLSAACRSTAARLASTEMFVGHELAHRLAMECVDARSKSGVQQRRRPRRPLPVHADRRKPRLTAFHVSATLPAPLADLERLAQNFWWCWNSDARALFRDLSPRSWEACNHNPVALLQRVYAEDLEARAADADYRARLAKVVRRFDEYLAAPASPDSGLSTEHPVAYFCAEFGLHESLRIYSGGLGILAGDHLKSASDLRLPLVAVGLFYRYGYFTQRLTSDGDQMSLDVENDPQRLAMEPVTGDGGAPLEITIPLPGRELAVRAWRVQVGRVALYLLDTDTPSNREEDRAITRNLYGGEAETRIQQEIVLGLCGVRLLEQLGIEPAVFHMNEGHAAFLTIGRVARLARERGLTFGAATECVRATTLFTTHTPVPAGHDRFSEDVMRRYFSDAANWVGVPWERFYALGTAGEESGEFNMTRLALHFASRCNGVSKLHGEVSRGLLGGSWPGLLEGEVPIFSVTNGVHLATWTHPRIRRTLGIGDAVAGAEFADGARSADRQRLWRDRTALKRQLLDIARSRLERAFIDRSDSPLVLSRITDGLDENALLIGFARRFAPYKRAQLLFTDPDRLRKLLDDPERPVRVLIAGKSHPRDQLGRDLIKKIIELARGPLIGRVIFLEGYDIDLARYLVQGVDIWLNNPIRRMEASGTSGMKAAANGGLNLSIGDGWWPEACDGNNGWQIGGERSYEDQELQNQFDANTLYRLLEEEIVPSFFDRDTDGMPRAWMDRVAHCLATVPAVFNTDRMVNDYIDLAYRDLGRAYADMTENQLHDMQQRAVELKRLRKGFTALKIVTVHVADVTHFRAGESLDVRAEIDLGPLSPSDVVVELVLGHAKGEHDLHDVVVHPLTMVGPGHDGTTVFEGARPIRRSGGYAHGLRVRARTNLLDDPLGDLVLWA